MTTDHQRVSDAIAAFKRGEIVVVTDDDDRENEGDLILAAVHATPEKLGFVVRHTSGIVCAPLTRESARRLQLQPMVADNDAPLGTAFTVSVDFRHGLTTGISAEERCNTVRALANPNAGPGEFVRPGHVFPLIARDGGVLMRSGHTEAAVDLCRLAGVEPVGVLAELVNDDGTVKRGGDVARFAVEHGLRLVSVADIIAHRQRSERLVERVAEFPVVTHAGPARAYAYHTPFDATQHLAVVFGDIGDGQHVPVRLHREAVIDDVFGEKSVLDKVLARLAKSGRGIVVYLREGSVGVAEVSARSRDAMKPPQDSTAARQSEWREVGLGAQILKDLGVTSIRLIASREHRYVGLSGFGIVIDETEKPEG
ncbi:MAG: 3,4-dihydroxy-2-butanone-4-phosphate synthase [Bauldia sp.]|nr:3,4-dihydroxy-2-butanone-4-phosphate synthase [Bauldia sp.]